MDTTEPLHPTTLALNAVRADALRKAAEEFRSNEKYGAHVYPDDLDAMATELESRR